MEGVKWVIFKVHPVNLFLMKESITVWQNALPALFPFYTWNVLLCLIYGLFMYVFAVTDRHTHLYTYSI